MIAYITKNFLLSILFFFKHWYLNSFQRILGKTTEIIRGLEKRLALRINVHFMFAPLWQERNVYGYALGFLFRGIRIIAVVVAYCLIVAAAAAVYLIWAFIPVGIIYQIISGGGTPHIFAGAFLSLLNSRNRRVRSSKTSHFNFSQR